MSDKFNNPKEMKMRNSRHGKPCTPRTLKSNPTLEITALTRGVTARQVAEKRGVSVRQARKILQGIKKTSYREAV